MITSAGWSSRCESGNCVETRTRTVEGCEYVEDRDTETDGTLLVTAKAWAEHEAAARAEGRQQAADAIVAHRDKFFPPDSAAQQRVRRHLNIAVQVASRITVEEAAAAFAAMMAPRTWVTPDEPGLAVHGL